MPCRIALRVVVGVHTLHLNNTRFAFKAFLTASPGIGEPEGGMGKEKVLLAVMNSRLVTTLLVL